MPKPVLVMPMNDPQGLTFPHLKEITPLLETIFAQTIVSIPPNTARFQANSLDWLEHQPFFNVCRLPVELPVGAHFHRLYTQAAQICPPEQILHLAYIDRVSFALQGGFRDQFIQDIRSTHLQDLPLIFQRSKKAWESHPINYHEIERMATLAGELVYRKSLDFAWCHLALQAGLLQEILPSVHNPDLSMVAEMIIQIKDRVQTRDVDWLAWEDPFILATSQCSLKKEREHSQTETRKRLGYVIPMLQAILEDAGGAA
jgi:hypothetical protein